MTRTLALYTFNIVWILSGIIHLNNLVMRQNGPRSRLKGAHNGGAHVPHIDVKYNIQENYLLV